MVKIPYAKVKKAIESLYKGKCIVTVRIDAGKDPVTKKTVYEEEDIYVNKPCRLSFQNKTPTTENSHAALINQTTTLFIAPELEIPPGSKITVTQDKRTRVYGSSGEPSVYETHQEIPLSIWEDWA